MAPQIVGTIVLLVLIFKFDVPWNAYRWFGLAMTLLSSAAFLTARYQLGSSFSVGPQARQLITRGIYAYIRNPIYVFSTLMILGTAIAYQHWMFLLYPACLVVVQFVRARRESRVLEEAFGDAYRGYRSRTWF